MIYLASSWRNEFLDDVVLLLEAGGVDFFDFRKNPIEGSARDAGFHWSEIDPDWKNWTVRQFTEACRHPLALAGFRLDRDQLAAADGVLLVLPCGKSAHLELGWAAGQTGVRTAVYAPMGAGFEPELMYGLTGGVRDSLADALRLLGVA